MSQNFPVSVFGRTQPPNEAWLARAQPEDPVESHIAIVDPHLHFWDRTGNTYLIQQFARDLADSGHRVEATVAIECGAMYRTDGPEHLRCVGETEFAVGIAAMAASGKYMSCRAAAGIVGCADLTLGKLTQEVLEAHIAAANGRFRAVRQSAKWDADPAVRGPGGAKGPGLYREAAFGKGIDALTALGLSFEASVFHPQIPDVTSLAHAHPEANIVLIHSGSPVGHGPYANAADKIHANWLASMRELARCPNVSVKLGGILMHIGNFDFTAADRPPTSRELAKLWRPYIEPCIELFGVDRCMASSNFPVDKAGFGYGSLWNMYKHITDGCSVDEKNALFSATARRVYRLP
ncbi:amidohydrolase [Burkholderia sp. Bp9143]|uniref:amidohydrolase family protein n=1 Tax=Burkholderia sp. Bp9143 TaxID=2184574 RepID=UPI000F5A2A52|nr:amidohydrolase family protein [Burkholderia sp. Bp9143]RQR22908.1 amidohydrolase [Burkholderia sp. Bp9143]